MVFVLFLTFQLCCQADCMLNLLKANHYKLLSAHAEVSGGPRPSSQFADYINTASDKHVRHQLYTCIEQHIKYHTFE